MKKLFTVIGGKFKFQVKDNDLEFFWGRFGDLKNQISLSEKRYLYILPRYYSKDLKDLSFKLRTPAKSSH